MVAATAVAVAKSETTETACIIAVSVTCTECPMDLLSPPAGLRVLVVGAGVSGLATANALSCSEVIVIERQVMTHSRSLAEHCMCAG